MWILEVSGLQSQVFRDRLHNIFSSHWIPKSYNLNSIFVSRPKLLPPQSVGFARRIATFRAENYELITCMTLTGMSCHPTSVQSKVWIHISDGLNWWHCFRVCLTSCRWHGFRFPPTPPPHQNPRFAAHNKFIVMLCKFHWNLSKSLHHIRITFLRYCCFSFTIHHLPILLPFALPPTTRPAAITLDDERVRDEIHSGKDIRRFFFISIPSNTLTYRFCSRLLIISGSASPSHCSYN